VERELWVHVIFSGYHHEPGIALAIPAPQRRMEFYQGATQWFCVGIMVQLVLDPQEPHCQVHGEEFCTGKHDTQHVHPVSPCPAAHAIYFE
jgi:anti-sigma factor ChrR (cupin superfamily)